MAHACQHSSDLWAMPSVLSFNFCLALKRSGRWTQSLKGLSNRAILCRLKSFVVQVFKGIPGHSRWRRNYESLNYFWEQPLPRRMQQCCPSEACSVWPMVSMCISLHCSLLSTVYEIIPQDLDFSDLNVQLSSMLWLNSNFSWGHFSLILKKGFKCVWPASNAHVVSSCLKTHVNKSVLAGG